MFLNIYYSEKLIVKIKKTPFIKRLKIQSIKGVVQ